MTAAQHSNLPCMACYIYLQKCGHMLYESMYICYIHIQLKRSCLRQNAINCSELAVNDLLACQDRLQLTSRGQERGGALVLKHSQGTEANYEYAACHCHLVSLVPIINKAAPRSSLRSHVRLRTLGCSACQNALLQAASTHQATTLQSASTNIMAALLSALKDDVAVKQSAVTDQS